MTPAAQHERMHLTHQIATAQAQLETLRKMEIDARPVLADHLGLLQYHAGRARFRIQTNSIPNLADELTAYWQNVNDANAVLVTCQKEIEDCECQIADMQGDLDDAAIWEGAA